MNPAIARSWFDLDPESACRELDARSETLRSRSETLRRQVGALREESEDGLRRATEVLEKLQAGMAHVPPGPTRRDMRAS